MHLPRVFGLVLSLRVGHVYAQTLQCATVPEGCDEGDTHEAVLRAAIERFNTSSIYGGRLDTFASAVSEVGTLAQISYSCNDGSVPPRLTGSTAQSLLNRILTCPNRCGGISVANNARCGFGVLIATNSDQVNCFELATDKVPETGSPAVKPSVGNFVSRGCRTDQESPRALSGGSSRGTDMTVERCVALAKGFRYAGVEYRVECYWGNDISSSTVESPPDQCSMSCAGNPLDICGDGNRINIYEDTTWEPSEPEPTPVVVPSVGSFKNQGCFFDYASGHRVLQADSTTDDSESGMTVEKCVDFARRNYWRYAGVEFGSQCFVGNTLRDAQGAPARDYNMPCAGNALELCGSGNRIEVYEDEGWQDPTKDEVLEALQLYHSFLTQARDLVVEYKSIMERLQREQGSNNKAKRGPSDWMRLTDMAPEMIRLEPIYQTAESSMESLVVRRTGLDVDGIGGPRVPENDVVRLRNNARAARQALHDVRGAVVEDAAAIAANPAQPLLRYNRNLSLAENMLALMGIPTILGGVIGKATVLFFSLAVVFFAISGMIPPPDPTPTDEPTSSASSSATPTPIVLLMAKDSTRQSFEDIVDELVKKELTVHSKVVYENVQIRSLTADMDEETIDKFLSDSRVSTLSRRIQGQLDASTSSNLKREAEVREDKPTATVAQNKTVTGSQPSQPHDAKRAFNNLLPPPFDRYLTGGQLWTYPGYDPDDRDAEPDLIPYHLQWLSAPWAMYGLPNPGQTYWALNDSIYDPSPSLVNNVRVYVLDTGARLTHRDIHENIRVSYDARVRDGDATDVDDTDGHGTCMASCVGGSFSGVFKQADIVPIKIMEKGSEAPWLDDVINAIALVEKDVKTSPGRLGVMSMSFGFDYTILRVKDGQVNFDPFQDLVSRMRGLSVVPVASSGNGGKDNGGDKLTDHTPRKWGGESSDLIVVGNADVASGRYYQSTYLDDKSQGILTVYAMGQLVPCADFKKDNQYIPNTGSSPATATIAGLVALKLATGQWTVANAKQNLVNDAVHFKGDASIYPDTTRDPLRKSDVVHGNRGLRAALGDNLIMCSANPQPTLTAQRPEYLQYTIPTVARQEMHEIRTPELVDLLTETNGLCQYPGRVEIVLDD